MEYLFSYPVYIYGKNEILDVEIPLNKVMVESIRKSANLCIEVNGVDFPMKVTHEIGGKSKKIYIGNAFEIDATDVGPSLSIKSGTFNKTSNVSNSTVSVGAEEPDPWA